MTRTTRRITPRRITSHRHARDYVLHTLARELILEPGEAGIVGDSPGSATDARPVLAAEYDEGPVAIRPRDLPALAAEFYDPDTSDYDLPTIHLPA